MSGILTLYTSLYLAVAQGDVQRYCPRTRIERTLKFTENYRIINKSQKFNCFKFERLFYV